MLENFIFSVNSALPIFFVMLAGYLLRKKGLIDGGFVKQANTLVFYVALPVKLFSDVFHTSFDEYFDMRFLLFIVLGTVLSAFGAWVIARVFVKDPLKTGAFVQGAFRGNFLYIGLSLMENITGSIGVKAPLAIAFIIPLYNILAVIILSLTNTSRKSKVNIRSILKNIASNPMIIAVVLGIIASKIGFIIPVVAERTMGYFVVLATPLALITIGASFKLENSAKNMKATLLASFLKLIIIPTVAVFGAVAMGFNNQDILLVFVLFGVPTATVSYVMTVAMNGDQDLASNIIMMTTLLSNFTLTLFIFLFKTLGYI